MIKKIIVLISFLASTTMIAKNDYNYAIKVCSKLSFDSEINRCLANIKGGYFETEPLTICNSLSFNSEKEKCLKLIKNKRYPYSAELTICSEKSFSSSKTKCLESITSFPQNQNIVSSSSRANNNRVNPYYSKKTVHNGIGAEQAESICDQFIKRQSKYECFNMISNAWFDPKVVQACNLSSFELNKVSCLGTIKNRKFLDYRQAANCQNPPYADRMINCLSRLRFKTNHSDIELKPQPNYNESIKHTQKALKHLFSTKPGKAKRQLQKAIDSLN